MLDPSSSEDTGGESDPEVVQEAPRKHAPSSGGKRGNNRRNPPRLELLSPGKVLRKTATTQVKRRRRRRGRRGRGSRRRKRRGRLKCRFMCLSSGALHTPSTPSSPQTWPGGSRR
ncbi:hypothetical protein KUCAC02_020521 [Chaenocephalus aceratus]|nr:hypothetical protein KUCAC02_020521 [Chaenocephalus aceratus]